MTMKPHRLRPWLAGFAAMLVASSATRSGAAEPADTSGSTRSRGAAPARDFAPAMAAAGLVDVQQFDPNIRVELKYSTTDNFLHADVYGDLDRCFLQRAAAQKLLAAQKALRRRKPEWSLLIYDCARPRSVQARMWALVKGTDAQQYVVSPKSGSMHNYGVAVDLTIADTKGMAIDMGTAYDFFGELAQPREEARFAREGQLSATQLEHRRLLREVMVGAGFRWLPTEWWHFQAFSTVEAKGQFEIVE
jgi:zinc D-Ala-D-Ala dipeptidase